MDKHRLDASLKEALFFLIVSDTDEIKELFKTDPQKAFALFEERFEQMRETLRNTDEQPDTYSFKLKGY